MFEIRPFGDSGLRIELGKEISLEVNQRVRSLSMFLKQANIYGVTEWIPSYTALTIYYNPYDILYDDLTMKIRQIEANLFQFTKELPPAKTIHIPVCYDAWCSPDLSEVAKHNSLTESEVISVHSSRAYLIYMLGFSPGFPYLGGMPKSIATPRLSIPRASTPAGSVGIAGEQTGIYSLETPGGWQIIGRTPVKLYDINRPSPFLLTAGNYIKFSQITTNEYKRIEELVIADKYTVKESIDEVSS